MINRAASREAHCLPFGSSSRNPPLKGSIQALFQADPGSMTTQAVPLRRHQSAATFSTKSGPLWKRLNAGGLRPRPDRFGDSSHWYRALRWDTRRLSPRHDPWIRSSLTAQLARRASLATRHPQRERRREKSRRNSRRRASSWGIDGASSRCADRCGPRHCMLGVATPRTGSSNSPARSRFGIEGLPLRSPHRARLRSANSSDGHSRSQAP